MMLGKDGERELCFWSASSHCARPPGAARACAFLFSDTFLVAVRSPSMRGKLIVQACVPLRGAVASDTDDAVGDGVLVSLFNGGFVMASADAPSLGGLRNGFSVTNGRDSVLSFTSMCAACVRQLERHGWRRLRPGDFKLAGRHSCVHRGVF